MRGRGHGRDGGWRDFPGGRILAGRRARAPWVMLARSRMPIPWQRTAGSSMVSLGGGVCFAAAAMFTQCRLCGQQPKTDSRREPQGDSLLVGHRIDGLNDGLLAVEQLVLPETAFRLPTRTACSPLFRFFRIAWHRLWGKYLQTLPALPSV